MAEDRPQPGEGRQAENLSPKRQRARQPKPLKRLHQPSCRMNEPEYARFTAAAAHCKMTNAAFLAYAVDKAARDLTRTAAEIATEREVLDEIFAARRHLGRIHGLFNQVAKALNSGADTPHLNATAQAVHDAARRMEEAADALLAHRDGGESA
ncbi:plasmid mobilization relaxosome protein MobC [Streptomyces caniferus]|uniref:Plasmid mobilization relaxosome protein MobC n=2 Tax=Streptomyces caniferus TaxID=285557 RepID=A0ABZ1VQ53_9ACTN